MKGAGKSALDHTGAMYFRGHGATHSDQPADLRPGNVLVLRHYKERSSCGDLDAHLLTISNTSRISLRRLHADDFTVSTDFESGLGRRDRYLWIAAHT